MPKLTRDLPLTITFRATAADVRKLAALAELTHRGQGEVLRLLLRQAVPADAADIRLRGSLKRQEVKSGLEQQDPPQDLHDRNANEETADVA